MERSRKTRKEREKRSQSERNGTIPQARVAVTTMKMGVDTIVVAETVHDNEEEHDYIEIIEHTISSKKNPKEHNLSKGTAEHMLVDTIEVVDTVHNKEDEHNNIEIIKGTISSNKNPKADKELIIGGPENDEFEK